MPRLSRSVSLLAICLLGCGKVTITNHMPPLDESNEVAPQVAKEVVVGAAKPSPSATSVPALEEPTADEHNWLKREELEAGWVRLFDGQTLFGWKANNDVVWSVKDGVEIGRAHV